MSGDIAELQPSYGRGTAERQPREGHKYSGYTAEIRERADTLSADPRAREKETPPGGCGRPESGSTRTSVEARHSLARDWDTLPVWVEAHTAGRRPHCSEATLVALDRQARICALRIDAIWLRAVGRATTDSARTSHAVANDSYSLSRRTTRCSSVAHLLRTSPAVANWRISRPSKRASTRSITCSW